MFAHTVTAVDGRIKVDTESFTLYIPQEKAGEFANYAEQYADKFPIPVRYMVNELITEIRQVNDGQ